MPVKQRPGRPTWTDAEILEARRLKDSGKTIDEIVDITGKPKNSVIAMVRSHRARLPRVAYVTHRPAPEVEAVRDQLAALRQRQSAAAAFLGEPPPGRREIVEGFLARQRGSATQDEGDEVA